VSTPGGGTFATWRQEGVGIVGSLATKSGSTTPTTLLAATGSAELALRAFAVASRPQSEVLLAWVLGRDIQVDAVGTAAAPSALAEAGTVGSRPPGPIHHAGPPDIPARVSERKAEKVGVWPTTENAPPGRAGRFWGYYREERYVSLYMWICGR